MVIFLLLIVKIRRTYIWPAALEASGGCADTNTRDRLSTSISNSMAILLFLLVSKYKMRFSYHDSAKPRSETGPADFRRFLSPGAEPDIQTKMRFSGWATAGLASVRAARQPRPRPLWFPEQQRPPRRPRPCADPVHFRWQNLTAAKGCGAFWLTIHRSQKINLII